MNRIRSGWRVKGVIIHFFRSGDPIKDSVSPSLYNNGRFEGERFDDRLWSGLLFFELGCWPTAHEGTRSVMVHGKIKNFLPHILKRRLKRLLNIPNNSFVHSMMKSTEIPQSRHDSWRISSTRLLPSSLLSPITKTLENTSVFLCCPVLPSLVTVRTRRRCVSSWNRLNSNAGYYPRNRILVVSWRSGAWACCAVGRLLLNFKSAAAIGEVWGNNRDHHCTTPYD